MKSKLSTLTLKSAEVSEKAKTRTVVITIFNVVKVCY